MKIFEVGENVRPAKN